MRFFQKFVVESSARGQEGDAIETTPFLFSKETQNKPSEFEIVFIHDGYLFQYGFSADNQKIHSEWLYATPSGQKKQKYQTWLERDETDAKKANVWKELKGEKELWKKSTRDNALFLSTAVQLNSEEFKKPFNWIHNFFRGISNPELLQPFLTIQQLQNGKKEQILQFMKDFDASFDDIEVVENAMTEADFKFPKNMPIEIKQKFMDSSKGAKNLKIFTLHKMEEGGSYPLELQEESTGTKRLFAFSALILDVLDNGYTLVVDEIHNSLHPHALKGIIALFQNKEINNKNAQLLFTTHDTNAMGYVEREQVWLMDKGKFGDTKLTSLSEFSGKPDEAVEKRYLGGRYGALPNIKESNIRDFE